MNLYSGWAAIALFVVMLALVASPLFSRADETGSLSGVTRRIETLDGLRGFLALGVATHHGIIYYDYFSSGLWRAPPSALFNQLGQASVGLFFIITAYLFWGKALRAKGISDFAALLTGRFFRIAPVYCFLMLVATFFSLMAAGFVIREPVQALLGEAARNFAFGVLPVRSFTAKRLGAISYGLYLVHGLILAAVFALPVVKSTALSSLATYWLVLACILSLAITAALLLRIFIELPGLASGRRFLASSLANLGIRQT